MICIFQLSALLVTALTGARSLTAPSYSDDYQNQYDSPRPYYSGDPAPQGFQFSSFRGPVSGAIREIKVPYVNPTGAHNTYYGPGATQHQPAMSVDYVAKPDYAFTYGVQDPESGNAQSRQEAREGDAVHGEYSVMEPDGTLRTVTYSADPIHGFQARVKYGPSGLPPPPPPTPSPTPSRAPQYAVHEGRYNRPEKQHRFNVNRRPVYRNYDEEEY